VGTSAASLHKRTGIEPVALKETTAAAGTGEHRQSSERQHADGCTKAQARRILADRSLAGRTQLAHDNNL